MSNDPRHHLGATGERLAAEHLERLGYRIVDRNYRTRWGELDIVALDGDALVFCEVKSRRRDVRTGTALEAVGPGKRARVRRMAARWLVERRDRPHADDLRFDAIGLTFDAGDRLVSLDHVEAAF
jgi:putative endonuclease